MDESPYVALTKRLVPVQKVLVANRGEIALRIIRSLKEMGIATVAVYSEADRLAPHVLAADEAVLLGPAPSNQSYLVIDKIVNAALSTGAQGIHPGYGFLSENASFAEAVTSAGLIFIGPSARSIEMMGDKLAAKQAAQAYGVPLVPGTETPIVALQEAQEVGKRIGYPILIKAAGGGGGKGMRVVEVESELPESLERASSEALAAFGNGAVFIEKYVVKPRHVEVQLLADAHGNVLTLLERDCSIQRRHQKVVEEAPAPGITPDVRAAMAQASVAIAKACQYLGAGTVEFLLAEDNSFYFLEMNTRLQVEHPVTELVTGLDLVKEQIKIARGEVLSIKQEDVYPLGHAIELRIYAEDPSNNFLPDVGTLKTFRPPQGPGIRWDAGYREGQEVPVYYDPLLAKLIVHAPTREEAIARMTRAMEDTIIEGVATTLPFGKFVLKHPVFQKGEMTTGFVAQYFNDKQTVIDQEDLNMEGFYVGAALGSHLSLTSTLLKGPEVIKEVIPTNSGISLWKLRGR